MLFSWLCGPTADHDLLVHEVSLSHTTTRVIRPSQRRPPDNTHSQQTDIHALGEIRTHDLSRPADVDLSLRPRGHWDRLYYNIIL
jgi:hypothetical protein